MTRLGIRVTDFVAANPGLTVEEIAKGVRARTQAVREVLTGKGFTSSLRLSYPSDTAKVYRVAPATRDGRGRVPKPSQCEKVSQVLADGHWHTAAEIHRRVGFCRLNSRIADLRRDRGWTIVCEHIKGAGTGAESYRYRLVATSRGDEASHGTGVHFLARDDANASRASSPLGAVAGTSERDEASQAVVARPAAVDGGCAPSASSRSDAPVADSGASGSDVQLGLEAA